MKSFGYIKSNNKIFKYYKYFKKSLIIIILIIINITKIYIKKNDNNKSLLYLENSKKILFQKNKEYYFHSFNKTISNFEKNRYHFKDIYNRKRYKINYSYIPYQKINKYISYDENAKNLFILNGILNITLLDFYYYGFYLDNSKLKHIHLSMSFDNNYALLSYVSIASILNTSNIDTYIHFHFILNNCSYEIIKSIIDLKKINNKIDLVFYNGIQAEYDFGKRPKIERRGIGEYTRLLIPQIINNTNKVIILDSADIIAQKDLSQIYNFDLEDNYFAVSLDFIAGLYTTKNIFAGNNFYFNGGVILINVTKYKIDNLYRKAQLTSLAYNYFACPYQDILLFISNFQFKFFPLNFNCPQFFENDKQMIKKEINPRIIKIYLNCQIFSPYRYSKEELLEAALNPIIIHLYNNKPFKNLANDRFTISWVQYAKLAGFYNKLKKKFPLPFERVEKLNNKIL